MAPSELLSVPGAAGYLGVSTGTIYLLTAAGKIGHYRIGQGKGTIRFTKDDLDAYLASTRAPSTPTQQAVPVGRVEYRPSGLRNLTPRASRPGKKGA